MTQDAHQKKTAIIIGAGPAGLTVAWELLTRTDITPIILEKSNMIGGLARSIDYKGNRMDIGPHRFFSKSDRVMRWWLGHLPLQHVDNMEFIRSYQTKLGITNQNQRLDPETTDLVMLLRNRKTRIYFLMDLFPYPIALNMVMLLRLGFYKILRIGISYVYSILFPIKPMKNLEDFYINRFGKELYLTFFKSYTEKLWGLSCREISAEWGAQRVKGLSVGNALKDFIMKLIHKNKSIDQKKTETSLIEWFLYPKRGAGQMWETVADKIRQRGGEIIMNFNVDKIYQKEHTVIAIGGHSLIEGQKKEWQGDYFFSTMPVQELTKSFMGEVDQEVREISDGLRYRDIILIGLLLKRLLLTDKEYPHELIRDNWLYIQEPNVQVARIQICNNMSPYLVAAPGLVWIGAEYFCQVGDNMWERDDASLVQMAQKELEKIGIIAERDTVDGVVIRQEKAYPVYFGAYQQFETVRKFYDQFDNLFLLGRNGMHKYNNQDHSMLTAMVAVDNIIHHRQNKENIWAVNTEKEYHEEK
ncbi:MAG: NAD(P)/FAD-dependent oxidoreductase [Patescibacteria group bacterium]